MASRTMRAWSLLCLAACGRIGFDGLGAGADGAANAAPLVAVTGPLVVYGPRTADLSVTADDPEGEPVTLAASTTVGSVVPIGSGFRFEPPFGFAGSATIRITARDARGGAAEATHAIEVVVLSSCLQILNQGFAAGDGVYQLVTASEVFFDAFCDMARDAGGWTLLAKIPPGDARFAYDGEVWTTADVTPISEGSLDLSADGALWSPASASVSLTDVMIGFQTTTGLRTHVMSALEPRAHLVDLLKLAQSTTSSGLVAESNARTAWITAVGGAAPGLQANCNRAGFSLTGNKRVRVGFQANEQADCLTPDSAIGLGIEVSVSYTTTVSGVSGCTPADSCSDVPHPQLQAFGVLLAR